jgi:hypothetical protein
VNAPTIFRRTSSRTRDAAGVRLSGNRTEDGFDEHAVLPPVAEVVDIGEFTPLSETEVTETLEPSILRRFLRVFVLRIRIGESAIRDLELVEVRVGPAHRLLDDHVKRVE